MYFKHRFERAFGTFPLTGDDLKAALNHALDVGYRAIDTAQFYANEADIGEVLAQSGVSRAELCITSKVPVSNFSAAAFIPSVEKSLEALKLESLDVLLLHWPPADARIEQPLEWLLEAKQRKLAQHIGVSNFTAAMLEKTVALHKEPMVCNQVEFHPLLNQEKLLKASAQTGIPLSSYCSLARGEVFKQPLLAELASAYEVTVSQIVLRWILQKGVVVNAMSTRRENLQANFDIMNFTLSNVDMGAIDSLTRANYRIVDKHLVPDAPDWD